MIVHTNQTFQSLDAQTENLGTTSNLIKTSSKPIKPQHPIFSISQLQDGSKIVTTWFFRNSGYFYLGIMI